MGRYAFFNTEFEYKFGFAVQASEDILNFGGKIIEYDESGGLVEWNSTDKDTILKKLSIINYNEDPIKINLTIKEDEELDENDYKLPINFDNFKKNLNGTQQLYSYFHHFHKNFSDEKDFYKYRLGCIIYHQLLYQHNLSAHYEG